MTTRKPAENGDAPKKWWDEWKWLATPVTLLLLTIAVHQGWITQGDADKLKPLVMVAKPVDAPEAAEPTRDTEAEAKAAKDIDWKAIIDQLTPIIIDRLKPRPEPEPKPKPTPDPEPPKPPLPSDSTIKITDETGKVVAAATVDSGSLFLATATGNIGWQSSRHGAVRLVTLPNNLGYAFSLDAGAWVEFFLTDYTAKTQTSLRVTANHSPMPPPEPKPEPRPEPRPEPATNRVLGLVVFADLAERNPEYAGLMASKYWQTLSDRHRVAIYTRTTNEPVGKAFLAETAGAKGATLLIRDDTVSAKLAVVPLPKTEAEFEAAIRAWSSR